MNRLVRRTTLLVAIAALVPTVAAEAQGGSTSSLFKVGYMDIGPTFGLGGIGDAGVAF